MRDPLPPAELLGALQDRVHTDLPGARPARAMKVRRDPPTITIHFRDPAKGVRLRGTVELVGFRLNGSRAHAYLAGGRDTEWIVSWDDERFRVWRARWEQVDVEGPGK